MPAPNGPEDGLCGQVDGQQAGRPLEQRQLRLVGAKPGMAIGQIGRANGQVGPRLNELLGDGLAQDCNLTHPFTDTLSESTELQILTSQGPMGEDKWSRSLSVGTEGMMIGDVDGWQSRTLNKINIFPCYRKRPYCNTHGDEGLNSAK